MLPGFLQVDEKMVRELVSKKGRTALTLRFHNLLDSEQSDTEFALALDCAPLLLGDTVIHATWPANAHRNLLLEGEKEFSVWDWIEPTMRIPAASLTRLSSGAEHYESVHARLEVKQPAWDEPQQAGETTEIAQPPQQKLLPDQLSKKLAPVLVTPDKVARLPDLPATKDSLSNSCHPVSLWYKFVGEDVTAHTHDGTPSVWQVELLACPSSHDFLQRAVNAVLNAGLRGLDRNQLWKACLQHVMCISASRISFWLGTTLRESFARCVIVGSWRCASTTGQLSQKRRSSYTCPVRRGRQPEETDKRLQTTSLPPKGPKQLFWTRTRSLRNRSLRLNQSAPSTAWQVSRFIASLLAMSRSSSRRTSSLSLSSR